MTQKKKLDLERILYAWCKLPILWTRKVHGTAPNCEVWGSTPLAGHLRFIFVRNYGPSGLAFWLTQCGPGSSALRMLTIYQPGDFVFSIVVFSSLYFKKYFPTYLLVVSSQSPLSCWLWWREPHSPIDFIQRKSTVSSPTDSWIIGLSSSTIVGAFPRGAGPRITR